MLSGISPLTPIIINSNPDLELVKQALITGDDDFSNSQYSGVVVPAIFLKYNSDKIRQDLIERGVWAAIDIASIAGSGGAIFVTKLGWAKRLWALAELSSDAIDLANQIDLIPNNSPLKTLADDIGLVSGIVSIKNVAKSGYRGIKKYANALRETKTVVELFKPAFTSTSAALEVKGGFKSLMDNTNINKSILEDPIDWSKYGQTSEATKKAIEQQQSFARKLLGIVENVDKKFFDLFGKYGITVAKQGGIISFTKGNTKIMEATSTSMKVLDESLFVMDNIQNVGNDFKRLEIKDIEIGEVHYQTDFIEVAPTPDGKIRCSGNGTYCFAQDTPLPDGSLMAEKTEGDLIIAYDTEKNTTTQAKISKIRRSFTSAFTHLFFAGTMLSVTPAHALLKVQAPFLGEGRDGIWVAAGQLHAGDHIRSTNGVVTIDSTYTEAVSPTPVVSFELEGGLDYVVGEMPVVVNNVCHLRTLKGALSTADYSAYLLKIKALNLTGAQRTLLLAETAKLTGTVLDDFIKNFNNGTDAYRRLFATEQEAFDIWKGLSASPIIRQVESNIQGLVSAKKGRTWTPQTKWNELMSNVNDSGSKKNTIDDIAESVKNGDSVDDILLTSKRGTNNRTVQAKRLVDEGKLNAAAAVTSSSNVSSTLKTFIKNLSRTDFDAKILAAYSKDAELYAKLTTLSNKLKNGGVLTDVEIATAFSGYEVHHIFSVNTVWNNAKFKNLLDANPTFLNSPDNLIFLKNPNIHQGSHPAYDAKIMEIMNGGNMDNIVQFGNKLSAIKNKMTTNLIGSNTKINNFDPTP